jgi:hypothetical protein
VFLLLLCNDRAVLGPWVNSRRLNVFTSAVIAVLVMLSIILTASVLFPAITATQILAILATGTGLALVAGGWAAMRRRPASAADELDRGRRADWRMPAVALLERPALSTGSRLGLTVLRGYLLVAVALLVVRVVQLALGH